MASETSAGLKVLHGLLQQLAEAEAGLADGPRRIAVAERQLAAGEQQIEQQKLAIRDAKRSADEANLRLRSKEAEILKLEGQLNTASTNKEYDIIKGQIVTAKRDRGDIEETGLLGLEAVDEAQKRLKDLEAELQKRRQQLQAAKADYADLKPKLEAGIAALQQQTAEAEKVVPGSEMATWKRLRAAHGAAAVAVMEDDFCSACSTRVTAQDMVRMRTGVFVICRDCGRALYEA
ncbi:MAG: zinc ribbon domain-containing protein [Planctomycetaceae bacterium]